MQAMTFISISVQISPILHDFVWIYTWRIFKYQTYVLMKSLERLANVSKGSLYCLAD